MSSVYFNQRTEVIKFRNFTLTTSFFWYDFSALHLSINFIHFTRQWCSNSVSFFSRYSSRISKFLTFLWKLSLQVLKEFDNWRKKYKFNVNYLFEYDFVVTKITSGLFSSIVRLRWKAFFIQEPMTRFVYFFLWNISALLPWIIADTKFYATHTFKVLNNALNRNEWNYSNE